MAKGASSGEIISEMGALLTSAYPLYQIEFLANSDLLLECFGGFVPGLIEEHEARFPGGHFGKISTPIHWADYSLILQLISEGDSGMTSS